MSLKRRHRFTSESVTEGHPDKLADQISDAVLDAVLEQDPGGKVACETLLAAGLALVAGEIRTKADLDVPAIVRETILAAGYTDDRYGLNGKTCAVLNGINRQSGELTKNADAGKAGDQGLMFGFACRETPELMPLPITLAHRLARRLAEVRKSGALPWLRPDGKTQVTVEYEDGRPRRVAAVLISAQHRPGLSQDKIKAALFAEVVRPVLGAEWPLDQPDFLCNPSQSFTVGGPQADCGLTGRKIIVDTYGGYARHGGGAFSGKDPSKVDRSAAYLARYIAKNIVAAGLAERAEVQLAYAIGRADPVSVLVDTQGTGQVDEEKLERAVQAVFPLTPTGIITGLRLRRPIYRATAAYGHFGREEENFTWERPDRVAELQRRLR